MKILVVDDQPRARQGLKALLSTWGESSKVWTAVSGREALRVLPGLKPDVIVMDARMPEMDGLETTRVVKRKWPGIKVVLLSMYADYHQEALQSGADAFVCKGEPPERLLDTLRILSQASSTQ